MKRQDLLRKATEGCPECEFEIRLRAAVVDRALMDLELESLHAQVRCDAAQFLLEPGRLEVWMWPLDAGRFIRRVRADAVERLERLRLKYEGQPLGCWVTSVLRKLRKPRAA